MENSFSAKQHEIMALWLSIMAKDSYLLLQKFLIIAKESTNLLKELSMKLPTEGQFEAMIFNSVIITLAIELNELKNSEELDEDLLTLLSLMFQEVIFLDKTIDDIKMFILQRRMFYMREYQKIINDKNYSSIKIYSSFYLTPLTGREEYCGDPWDVMSFQFALYQLISLIKQGVGEAINSLDTKSSFNPENSHRSKLSKEQIDKANRIFKETEQQQEQYKKMLNKRSGCFGVFIVLISSISLLSAGIFFIFNVLK